MPVEPGIVRRHPKNKKVFAAIEGVRALGALSVATSHGWNNPIRDLPWFNGSFLVVEMFFVLSGYLLTRVLSPRLQRPADAAAEIVRRLGRLYPLHLTVLLAWLVIFYGKQLAAQTLMAVGVGPAFTPIDQQVSFDTGYFLLNLVMLHGVGIQDSDLFNFPAWSISVDFWSFVVVAAVFTVVRHTRTRRAVLLAMMLLCLLHYLAVWMHGGNPAAHSKPLIENSLSRGLLAYLYGVLAAELQTGITWRPSAAIVHVVQAMLALAIPFTVANQSALPLSQAWVPALWACLIVSLAGNRGWLAGLLSWRPLGWIGRRSYAIYISHALLLLVARHPMMKVSDPRLTLLGWVAYIAAAILLADVLHRRIEKQAFEPFKRLAARVRAAPPPASPAAARPMPHLPGI
ncbi:MAG: acyltransferase [Burkholderiaceae bacterium]